MSGKIIHYICLDDKATQIAATIQRFELKEPRLKCVPMHPEAFEDQIEALTSQREGNKLDGLLLDLRLDESPDAQGKRVRYSAQSLAQQLRTLMAEKKLPNFPIVLWTINNSNFNRSYAPDRTSHDLFDLVLAKQDANKEEESTAAKLVSLANGYNAITKGLNEGHSLEKLLKVPSGISFDLRIGAELREGEPMPVHIYARFIIRDLLLHSGPLVDERLLFARLGVDLESGDRAKLLGSLGEKALYKGPFGDGWQRWWWSAVEGWWQLLTGLSKSPMSLSATERVELLRRNLKLRKLNPAKCISSGYGTYFSTICAALGEPLDPIDGFVILPDKPLRPWQDRLYVSGKAALAPGRWKFRGKLDPFEKERLRLMRGEVGKTA